MSSFDERVMRVVEPHLADLRLMFLDERQAASPSSPRIVIGYGIEGVKAEIAKEDNNSVEDSPPQKIDPSLENIVKELFKERPDASDDESIWQRWRDRIRDVVNIIDWSQIPKRVWDWFEDIDGVDDNKIDVGKITRDILTDIHKLIMLAGSLWHWTDSWAQGLESNIRQSLLMKELYKSQTMLEKIEREVEEAKSQGGMTGATADKILEILRNLDPGQTGGDVTNLLSEMKILQSDMEEIRGLLRRATGYTCDETA